MPFNDTYILDLGQELRSRGIPVPHVAGEADEMNPMTTQV